MSQVAEKASRVESRQLARYLIPYPGVTADPLAERAANGDPEALREVFSALRAFLRGEQELPMAYADYLEDALGSILGELALWSHAASSFQEESRKGTEEERLLGRGPRVPEPVRRKFGTLFCRAFGISKSQGRDYKKYQEHLTPEVVWRVHLLQKLGATRARAIKIVKSNRPLGLSERQVREWFRRADWLELDRPDDSAPPGELASQERLAYLVEQKLRQGSTMELACNEVAEIAVKQLCHLPAATVYLDPKVVQDAYEYVVSKTPS